MFKLSAVAALILALLLASAVAQEQTISAKKIQDTWVGKTVSGITAKGVPVTLKLNSDGSASVLVGSTSDTGNWRLSEHGYCAAWKTIRNGEERCFTVRKNGTKMTVINPDGSVNSEITEVK